MIYVDTSVVVPLLINEAKSSDVAAWYSGLTEASFSSDWLLTEFASAVAIKLRRGELSEANAKAVHKEFDALMAGGLRTVPVSRPAFRAAMALVKQHQHALRSGDALHLAIAQESGATAVATLDSLMAANARRLGLSVEAI